MLGWTPESWATVQDWAERMHPDDRQWVVDFCVAQSKSGVDHEADYRGLTKDGTYVWLRDVVHVVRTEDGTVEALVGFMFDISERKKTEERVVALQKDLEDLSFRDGLTGIGNRRRFDTLFGVEWAAARPVRAISWRATAARSSCCSCPRPTTAAPCTSRSAAETRSRRKPSCTSIEQVDKRLYRAKASGRNTIVGA